MSENGRNLAKNLVLEGVSFFKKSDWTNAIVRFQQALSHDPRSLEAAKGISHILQMSGNPKQAAPFTRLALSLCDEPDPLLLTHLADQAMREGDLDTPIHALTTAGSLLLKKKSSTGGALPIDIGPFDTLSRLLWEAGRRDEAIAIFSVLYKIRYAAIDLVSVERNLSKRALFLYYGGTQLRGIGDVCTPMEILIKAIKLGMAPDIEYCFLLHDKVTTNKTIIDYFAKYVTVIKDKEKIKEYAVLYNQCEFPAYFLPDGDVGGFHWYEAWHEVVRRWREQGEPPLLTLEEKHRRDGWKALEELGAPKDAWFVCLHVREGGYHQDDGTTFADSRTADIADYMQAIDEITGRGGWVIRMGDPSMTPLEPMENVIDYATGPAKSEWMDVFLCAACRFFIGTNSGLGMVPLSFGVPTIQTNMLPVSFFTTLDDDLFIHRIIHRKEDGAPLSIREMFSPPYINNHNAKALDGLGVELKPNTPEEITAVVQEMMDRLDGRPYAQEENDLVKRYYEASSYRGLHSHGRPGQLFIKNHERLY